jgi:hypothetical protein
MTDDNGISMTNKGCGGFEEELGPLRDACPDLLDMPTIVRPDADDLGGDHGRKQLHMG